jgi:dienelactone hydrolase
MKKTLALVGAIAAAGCVSVDTDANEKNPDPSAAATVEFDPGNSVVPFPNNLLLDRTTGKVNLPAQCGESPTAAALRQLVVNALDGFGTFKTAMRVTFTKEVDMASIGDTSTAMAAATANIRMYLRASGTTVVAPADAKAIPLRIIPGTTPRFDADCKNPKDVNSLTIVPLVPLAPRSTYTVVVLSGIKSKDNASFGASSTWGLVRQKDNPVTVENGVIISDRTPLDPNDEADKATLLGLDLLWKAHAQGVAFSEAVTQKSRNDVLLAWEFTTQTTTAPLDPAVAGSPATAQPKTQPTGVTAIDSGNAPAHMAAVLSGAFGAPASTCTLLGCAAVGGVYTATLSAPNYQSPGTNPLAGGSPVPGPWSNPVTPTKINDANLSVQIFIPTGTRPATGWPTVVFGHGLGGSRQLSYLIASQLAGQGFATVAIDFVAHGSRAVRISNTGLCADSTDVPPVPPSPTSKPQCFAPIFSTNLATTRDNVRQSVLDVQRLINAIGACTPTAQCGGLAFDSAKVGYMGISLGGIIGSVISSTMNGAAAPNIKASVLNVPAVGLVDILENTQTLAIRCSTVDGLIDAGIIMGTKWNGVSGPGGVVGPGSTGTCTTDEWKAQPGYLTFSSIARWILDSSDGANFVGRLPATGKKFLIQQVVGDTVVPNVATNTMAALTGFTMPAAGDTTAGGTLPLTTPSTAITSAFPPMFSGKWVQYTTTAEYVFRHGSLLSGAANPSAPTTPELLGTNRMQLDAITFLLLNL